MKFIKKTRFILVFAVFLSLLVGNFSEVSAMEIQPNIVLIPCDGSFNEYISKTTGNRELFYNTGIFLDPGDSMSCEYGISKTVTNEASFNLLPELMSMGYSYSVSVSSTVSVTVNNTTSSMKEVKAYWIYDNVKYTKGTYQGSGSCSVSTAYTRVYKGKLLTCQ